MIMMVGGLALLNFAAQSLQSGFLSGCSCNDSFLYAAFTWGIVEERSTNTTLIHGRSSSIKDRNMAIHNGMRMMHAGMTANLRRRCALLQTEQLEGVILSFGVTLETTVIFIPDKADASINEVAMGDLWKNHSGAGLTWLPADETRRARRRPLPR
jgi:hypothetical protein